MKVKTILEGEDETGRGTNYLVLYQQTREGTTQKMVYSGINTHFIDIAKQFMGDYPAFGLLEIQYLYPVEEE